MAFPWANLPRGVVRCDTCKFFQGLTCAAYPEGIPSEIFFGERDHRTPYKDDGGILWQPNDRIMEMIQAEEREKGVKRE